MSRLLPQVVSSVDDLPENAWERLPGETTAAYRWFVRYREMDSTVRSITRLAKEHGRSPGGHIRTWAADFFWTARVAKWDDYLEQQARDAQIAAVREGASVRAQLALGIFEKLYDRVVGKEAVVDEATGEVLERGVHAIDPAMLDAKDIAALGGIAGKLLSAAEEHAGERPLDEQRVNVTLSFDLDSARRPGDDPAPPAPVIPLAPPHRELPPGEPDAAA